MKNLIIPITLGIVCTSFTLLHPATSRIHSHGTVAASVAKDSSNRYEASTILYNQLHLQTAGLSREAFSYAMKGYTSLLKAGKIRREQYLTICDFSQSSRQRRLYIIDITNGQLILNTYVAHGKNSGAEYATQFSNQPESLQSSLGFYITGHTYIGEHGLSLRIDGVDRGFNDKAMMRSIVIHGADYVDAARAKQGMYMGRSWGCPAVSSRESNSIITTIKEGTCLFIYHPSRNYLQGSSILNG